LRAPERAQRWARELNQISNNGVNYNFLPGPRRRC
jgi:hypothetical protein